MVGKIIRLFFKYSLQNIWGKQNRYMASPIKTNLLQNLNSLISGKVPGQLVIQFTNHCNAKCPQCGMRVTEKFERKSIPVQAIKRIIDAANRRNIQSISFTGGEPLLFLEDLTELIRYANQTGIPMIRTGTNGFIFTNHHGKNFTDRIQRVAEKLLKSGLRNFWISIDSANAVIHERMRGFSGLIDGLQKGLQIFHKVGIFPTANMGINRNMNGWFTAGLNRQDYNSENEYLKAFYNKFQTGFERFIDFLIRLGFTMVSFCYPMSTTTEQSTALEPVYAAASDNRIITFNSGEKACMFIALLSAIERLRSRIRIFTPLSALYALSRQYAENNDQTYPCRGGLDYFFIDANNGLTYPCGYRGNEVLGYFEQGKTTNIKNCRLCDWECFRDPSELFGPLLQLVSDPLALSRKIKKNPNFFRYWINDIRYYMACDFFDGRKPLVQKSLIAFKPIMTS